MRNPDQWFRFFIALLAVWRLTHLLAAEDGPWNIIALLRRQAGSTVIGKLMDCFYCLSIWISIPFCLYVTYSALDRLVAWLALSGAASLLHQFTSKPADFDPFAETKEPSNK